MLYIKKERRTGVASKLLLRKMGPFTVIRRCGENAYEIDLIGNRSKVVNVKLLSHYHGQGSPPLPISPIPGIRYRDDIDEIFDKRVDDSGRREFLIRWANKGIEDDLWITEETFASLNPLPATLNPGVTVVVSPLLSLIQDQIVTLNLKFGIPATFLSSQQNGSQAAAVLRELRKNNPSCKLIYVTPERIAGNLSFLEILRCLRQNGLLAGFVIDEAHCVRCVL
ncbi:hypothetical protein GIB67_021868 [Kingdonia uniflora]|uniref:Helicase ATP-binding domain-containing protein n=1 Tax=Kingdonia uniflora TaxID=39325 RepID=A0A7J7NFE7_9MAGN|nr:hypothetical protein GIB67_021868 [Kingdonia uniflora]